MIRQLFNEKNQRNYSVSCGQLLHCYSELMNFLVFFSPFFAKYAQFASGSSTIAPKFGIWKCCIYRSLFIFFSLLFMCDVRCKDEFGNAENDIRKHAAVINTTSTKKISLYLWVNRSIGAIHVCIFLGWPKLQLVPT